MVFNLMPGDCLERMKEIPDHSVDFILTDPPYGTTACKWDTVIPFEPMWEQIWRVLKPNGACALFGSEPFSSHLRMSQIKYFKYDWIWCKNTGSGIAQSKYMPMKFHENISLFYRELPSFNKQKIKTSSSMSLSHAKRGYIPSPSTKSDHHKGMNGFSAGKWNAYVNPRSLLNFKTVHNRSKNKFHPTQKPVALLEYLIKTYTLENETVLDFTMGSGSTGVACANLNRKFIGIEKDEKYFEIAQNRIKEILK